MLIDNRNDRYPQSGLGIKTVWDFINMYSGSQSQQTGRLDIVTGYFTIRALSKLYRDIPETDAFRIVSSEKQRAGEEHPKCFLPRQSLYVQELQSSWSRLLSDR